MIIPLWCIKITIIKQTCRQFLVKCPECGKLTPNYNMVNFLARYVICPLPKCHVISFLAFVPIGFESLNLKRVISFLMIFNDQKKQIKTQNNQSKLFCFTFPSFLWFQFQNHWFFPFSPRCRGRLCCGRLRRGAAVCHRNVARRPQRGAAGSAAERWSHPEMRQGSHGRSMKIWWSEDNMNKSIIIV